METRRDMTTFRQQLRGRYAVLGLIVLACIGVLLARLWSMQVLSGASFAAAAEDNRVRQVSIDAARGRILDAKGKPLVTNRPVMAVFATPAVAEDRELLTRVSSLIDVPVPDIVKRLSSYKKERLAPRLLRVDVPLSTVAYLVEHQTQYPGVTVEAAAVREYPNKGLAAHVVGYTGEISEAQLESEVLPDYSLGDTVGKAGVEAQYNKVLQGVKGYQRFEVDSQGRVRRVISQGDPRAGSDIMLTIDKDIQDAAENALAEAIGEAHRQDYGKARAGAIVVLDVRTGAIVAMASAPSYRPSEFLGGISSEDWKRLNAKGSEYPLNNRAIMGNYPPGSTFKAVTGMAGLEYKIVTPGSSFYCPGKWTGLGKQWSKWCWDHAGHGGIGFTQGIISSCDSVFYEIGKRFYNKKGEPFQDFSRKAGFGRETGVDLPGEAKGRVPDVAWKSEFNKNYPEYQQWLPGDTVNMAIGQGDLLVTPLQLASYYGALANGGKVMKPHVLKAVLGADGRPVLKGPREVTSDTKMRKKNLAAMRSALVGVTRYGTGAASFRGFPYAVAGKTGTSQVKGKDDYAFFAAYAPANKPRYAIAVVVEQGGHGGSVAAPAARQVLSKLFGVPYHRVRATDNSR
jgi:penicillin-binding protein 2